MSNQRLRIVLLAGLGFVSLILVSVSLGAGTLLAAKSKKLVELKLQSKIVDAQSSSLAQSKKEVKQYTYFNDIAKTVLPNDKDQAQAVLDILQLAASSGISIASISFPASTLGAKSPAPSNSDKAASSSTQSVISQAKPVEGIPGLYSIEMTITPETGPNVPAGQRATYGKLLDFLSRIEHNRRTAQITQVNIQPVSAESGPGQFINFTLNISIFIKP
ncbi:hypothetical protein HYW35_02030 [Candidatus Saccharibacteria bacterium]|nr:hypothetical protein [Candidatus Saccharibacteria bacterium]